MISQCFNEAKQKFNPVITITEELEMCIEESVWESDYGDKQAEIEEYYSRMVAEIGGVAVEYEEVCAKQEKQKKVEEAAAAAAAKGVVEAVGGGAAVGGLKYRAEMALCPDKLAADSTGLEYCAFCRNGILTSWHQILGVLHRKHR